MAAIGMCADGVSQTAVARSSTMAKPKKTAILPQRGIPGTLRDQLPSHREIGVQWPKKHRTPAKLKTKTYLQEIFYDFKSHQDKIQKNAPTDFVTYENLHMPISASLFDTLECETMHICDANPIEKFIKEQDSRE